MNLKVQPKEFKVQVFILIIIEGGYPINLLESPITKENN